MDKITKFIKSYNIGSEVLERNEISEQEKIL